MQVNLLSGPRALLAGTSDKASRFASPLCRHLIISYRVSFCFRGLQLTPGSGRPLGPLGPGLFQAPQSPSRALLWTLEPRPR